MNKVFMFILSIAATMLCGCITKQIEVPVVRPWEGRYESREAAVAAAQTIQLEKGESVWLLSSPTLGRLLKTFGRLLKTTKD